MLAQAAQTYGIVVRDEAGAVSLYAQDPKSIGTNPSPAALDNWYPNTYLSWLPWDHLAKPSKPKSPPAGAHGLTQHHTPDNVAKPDDAGRYAADKDGVRRHVRDLTSKPATTADHSPIRQGPTTVDVRREPRPRPIPIASIGSRIASLRDGYNRV